MAKFEGGAISTLGIKGSFLTELATQTASSGVSQALGQVWQGSGQSFYGKAGQAMGGALAGSAVNIALNSVFNGSVPGPAGFTLDSGQNILASVVTPYVTNNVSEGINQNIQKSLQNAGPFGPALSGFATGLVSRVSQSITDTIFGATTRNGPNLIAYPGGGGPGEAPADYGGSAYTLTDIVFSLQPANQGPQAFGQSQSYSLPKTLTTVSTKEFTNVPPIVPNQTADILKSSAMVGGLSKKAFSTNLSSTFRVQ